MKKAVRKRLVEKCLERAPLILASHSGSQVKKRAWVRGYIDCWCREDGFVPKDLGHYFRLGRESCTEVSEPDEAHEPQWEGKETMSSL